MLKIEKSYITCDYTSCTKLEKYPPRTYKHQWLTHLKKQGWTIPEEGETYCPKHALLMIRVGSRTLHEVVEVILEGTETEEKAAYHAALNIISAVGGCQLFSARIPLRKRMVKAAIRQEKLIQKYLTTMEEYEDTVKFLAEYEEVSLELVMDPVKRIRSYYWESALPMAAQAADTLVSYLKEYQEAIELFPSVPVHLIPLVQELEDFVLNRNNKAKTTQKEQEK